MGLCSNMFCFRHSMVCTRCIYSEADPVVSWHVSRWWQADATYAAMAVKVSKYVPVIFIVI